MKQAHLLITILSLSFGLHAQTTGSDKIEMICDTDTMRFIVNGEETTIANIDMANFYFAQGIEAASIGDFKSAEDKFRVALLYDLFNPEILYNLGLAQYYRENYDDALVTFDKALELDKDNKDLYNQRALCNAILGDYEKAETDFIIMLQYDPNYPIGNYNYGILLLQKGDYASACMYLQKADEYGYENAPVVLSNFCN